MSGNVRVFTDEELKVGDVVAQGDWYLVRIAELPKSAKPRASSALGEEADMQSGNRPRFVLRAGLPPVSLGRPLLHHNYPPSSGYCKWLSNTAVSDDALFPRRYIDARGTATACDAAMVEQLSSSYGGITTCIIDVTVSHAFHYFVDGENDFFVSSSSTRPHIVSNGQLYDVEASELSKAILNCTGVYVPEFFHGPVFQGGTLEHTETDPRIKHGTLVFPQDAVMAAVRQQEMNGVARD